MSTRHTGPGSAGLRDRKNGGDHDDADHDEGNTNDGNDGHGEAAGDSTTPRRGKRRIRRGSSRSEALRRAHEAKQARDARLRMRELDVETILADVYQAEARADEITHAAQERARRLLDAAHTQAAAHRHQADDAIRRLRALGQSRAAIRELSGLPAARIAQALTHARAQPEPDDERDDDVIVHVEGVASVGATTSRPSAREHPRPNDDALFPGPAADDAAIS